MNGHECENRKKWKRKNICNNCGMQGHLFFSCKRPIMSFGIICYRYNSQRNINEYLLVRRKDSLGYVDFLRGKYNVHNDFHIKQLVAEMTDYEIDGILNNEYSQLWSNLWNKKNEKFDSKINEKFDLVKTKKKALFTQPIKWNEPEWGFPKGRRSGKENDYECSVREFEEETGYSSKHLIMIKNVGFIEEIFTGSNAKSYKHKYYICKMNHKNTLCEKNFQKEEISDLKWFSYCECISKIRDYNHEKLSVLKKVNSMINNNLYI